jgi:prefoldin subunit 5
VEALSQARNELESRCDNYVREIQRMQEENSKTVQSLQYQLQSLQDELSRLRSQNHALQLANNQLENSKQTLELLNRDNQKKIYQLEEKVQSLSKELHGLVLQKQNLQSLYDTLHINYEKLKDNRLNEFQIINSNILNAVKNEFDNMKIHFNFSPSSQFSAQNEKK